MEATTSSPVLRAETPSATQSQQNNQRRRHRTRRPKSSTQGEPSDPSVTDASSSESFRNGNSNRSSRSNQRINRADPSRVVTKPKRQNPRNQSQRALELEQLKRGYSSLVENETDSAKFSMVLKPSDPDFAFDISNLQFDLYVPTSYPRDPPLITVTNSDIPKGFSVNVDLGFREMAKNNLGTKSLLDLMNELDKNLESFLKQEKRQTIKIVKFKSKPSTSTESSTSSLLSQSQPSQISFVPAPKKLIIPPEIKKARNTQLEQLAHRLGPDVIYLLSSDSREAIYSITLRAPNTPDPELFSSLLPHEFGGALDFTLHVPSAYSLEPCSIIITSVLEDGNETLFPASVLEENFNKNAQRHTEWTLLSHVNFLASRLGKLLRPDYLEYLDDSESAKENITIKEAAPKSQDDNINDLEIEKLKLSEVQNKARRILMALNPSKVNASTETEEDTNASQSFSVDPDEVMEEESIEEEQVIEGSHDLPILVPRGVALLLPGLSMKNIAILESRFINLVVKCDRCNSQNDFFNITSGPFGRDSKPLAEECSKCKAVLAVCFRKNLIHLQGDQAQRPVAGYFEFSGCQPFDILASSFIPTCGNCATPLNDSPFKHAERSKRMSMNCRECHIRMFLELVDIQFEKISEDILSTKTLQGVRVVKRHDEGKQKLGIVSGTPLPDDGACTHYRKSRRWYRFSCCGKIFPCGKCHDAETDHLNEYATRIVCGHCSREQNISAVCSYCRFEFQPRESGFWEGGKGTRDQTKLNRKDTHKYKRLTHNKNGSTSARKKKPESTQS